MTYPYIIFSILFLFYVRSIREGISSFTGRGEQLWWLRNRLSPEIVEVHASESGKLNTQNQHLHITELLLYYFIRRKILDSQQKSLFFTQYALLSGRLMTSNEFTQNISIFCLFLLIHGWKFLKCEERVPITRERKIWKELVLLTKCFYLHCKK